MSYYYEYTFSDLAEFLSSPEGMAVAGVVLFFLAFLAVQYVFQSLSLYAIARRRGIAHPGLAWVPVAYSWILGSISDQYQYVVQGKIRNYRKILLALAVVSFFFSGAGVLLMANWGTVLVALQGEFSFLHHEVGQAAAPRSLDCRQPDWWCTNISVCMTCTSLVILVTAWLSWCCLPSFHSWPPFSSLQTERRSGGCRPGGKGRQQSGSPRIPKGRRWQRNPGMIRIGTARWSRKSKKGGSYMELYGSFALRPGDEVAFAGAMLMCMGIGMVLSVACYVLEALSLYTIAQRRGIRKPWLAWIPVVNVWIVGSISDQYQYVVNRRIQNRRKVLLGLAIACGVTFLGYTVCLLGVAGRALMNEADGLMVAWLLFAMLFVLAAFAIVVTYTVFAFISLYYVYKSCNPDTAVVFLVLSIVIPATMPFFLLADRNLDRGMPPRRQEPQPLPETAQNVEPTGKEPAEASPEEPESTSQEL